MVAALKSGREWLVETGCIEKISEIINKGESEWKVLYNFGKMMHRWANARDGIKALSDKGLAAAATGLLEKHVNREGLIAVEWLAILEFYQALVPLTMYYPEQAVHSHLPKETVKLMERIYAMGDDCKIPYRESLTLRHH